MLRIRHRLPVAMLALLASTSPAWAQVPVHYGTTQLGEVRTACFTTCFGTGCSASGTISTLAVNPPYFVRGVRVGPDSANLCNSSGVTTPATLPVAVGPGKRLVWDVDLVPTQAGSFQSILLINQSPQFNLDASVVPVTSCTPSTGGNALCLNNDRFKTRITWRTRLGTRGSGTVVPFGSDDSGLFYFFGSENWEALIKVLDGCGVNNRYWVFGATTTNVEYTLIVTDTQSQQVKTYFNPLGNAAPAITDTQAFATCP